jgi:hypothetical protein
MKYAQYIKEAIKMHRTTNLYGSIFFTPSKELGNIRKTNVKMPIIPLSMLKSVIIHLPVEMNYVILKITICEWKNHHHYHQVESIK